jgi:multiple sugar transport system substrate-binding protein
MHKRNSRLVAAVAAAATAGLLLAGCSAGGDSNTSDGVSTIQFWHRTFTPVENDWYKDIVKQYNASQDKIKVVDTEVPADAWDQKMKAAQAAGKAPDIYTFSASITDAVNAGQLHELNGLVPDDKLAEIIDPAQPISQIGGKYYAYPLLLEPQTVLFWNKDLLSAAGLDPETGPTSWDELLEMCAAIKPTLADGQYCISPASDAVTFAWSSVGQQYNFAGHTALNDDWSAPDIDNAGYRQLMANYKTLWDKGYMAQQALDVYVGGKDFGEEKVAFKVSGSWMMSEIGSDYADVLPKTGIGPFPNAADADGRGASTLGNFRWVIDAKSKNAQAAADFLTWALAGDPELLVPFFVNTQFTKVPVRASVQDAVSSNEASADAPWSSIVMNDIVPTAIPEPTYPWDVSLAVGTAMEAVMKGAASEDDAIKTAEDAINTVIQRDDLPSKAPKS